MVNVKTKTYKVQVNKLKLWAEQLEKDYPEDLFDERGEEEEWAGESKPMEDGYKPTA